MPIIIASAKRISRSLTQFELEHPETRNGQWTSETDHGQPLTQAHMIPHEDIGFILQTKTTVQKGDKLGLGGFGHVFKAVQTDTQSVVVLKQSRAPLRLKRPVLQHEARVLKLLSGRPGFPEVYAYDALKHVHSHSLIHSDIKPDNVMLQGPDSWKLCLIDLGLTRRLATSVAPTSPTTNADSDAVLGRIAHVFGTLPFASLNAHEKDPEFGELLDCARSLPHDEKPNYEEWRRRFKLVESATGNDTMGPEGQLPQTVGQPTCPVEVGQIVLIKIYISVTVDGYSIQQGHESSFIPGSFIR
ncbi:hypothetical protein OPQ81_003266 [Rhizoctonia solani]|nr:hypothetical protein OPQ81_003266 [Rhizoctonia solani]